MFFSRCSRRASSSLPFSGSSIAPSGTQKATIARIPGADRDRRWLGTWRIMVVAPGLGCSSQTIVGPQTALVNGNSSTDQGVNGKPEGPSRAARSSGEKVAAALGSYQAGLKRDLG